MICKKDISVVIPCYNSEKSIESVVINLEKTLSEKTNSYEILLINDGSTDKLWNIIRELCKNNKKIIGINLSKNFGQHSAIMAGLKETKGQIVITMDDDGQTDPKQVWKLIDKIEEGYDVAIADYGKSKESLFRRLGSTINKSMAQVLVNQPANIKDNSYRAMKKYVVEEIVKYDKPYPYLTGLIFRITQNVTSVKIEHLKRLHGKSGYSIKKLVELIMNGFTAFSVKPLRIATYTGLIVASMGFIYGIIIIIRKLIKANTVLGYSSIMAVILFIGGVMMIMLGLIGEYIGRIYISINNSPQYVIKEKIEGEDF